MIEPLRPLLSYTFNYTFEIASPLIAVRLTPKASSPYSSKQQDFSRFPYFLRTRYLRRMISRAHEKLHLLYPLFCFYTIIANFRVSFVDRMVRMIFHPPHVFERWVFHGLLMEPVLFGSVKGFALCIMLFFWVLTFSALQELFP